MLPENRVIYFNIGLNYPPLFLNLTLTLFKATLLACVWSLLSACSASAVSMQVQPDILRHPVRQNVAVTVMASEIQLQKQDTLNTEPVSAPLLLSQPRLPALPPAQRVQVAEIKVPVVPVISSSATPSTSSGSGGVIPAPVTPAIPSLRLDDIALPDGQSILGKNAVAALRPDVNTAEPLTLTLKGQFDSQPPLTVAQVRLTQVNNLAWQPISVSASTIVLQLNPQFRTDLKLVGPQTVDVRVGTLSLRTQIKVGPGPTAFTTPELLSAQVSGNQLTVTGRWLMNNPKFQQLKVNQVVVAVQGVQMDGQGVYTLRAQVPAGILTAEGNGVQVATPFGMAYREVGL